MLDYLRATAAAITGKAASAADQRTIDRLLEHMLVDQDDRPGLPVTGEKAKDSPEDAS